MNIFNGRANAKIEDNGRISLPKIFLHAISQKERNELYLACESEKYILAYPRSYWLKRMKDFIDQNFEENKEIQEKVRNLQEGMKPIKVDKQGRFYIPAEIKERVGINRDVAFVGMITRIEVWDPEKLAKHLEESRK